MVIRLRKFRVAVIGVLPVAVVPSTTLGTYSLFVRSDVIVITGIRFPCKYLIQKIKLMAI